MNTVHRGPFRPLDPTRYAWGMLKTHWKKLLAIQGALLIIPLIIGAICSAIIVPCIDRLSVEYIAFIDNLKHSQGVRPHEIIQVFLVKFWPWIMLVGVSILVWICWYISALISYMFEVYDSKPFTLRVIVSSLCHVPALILLILVLQVIGQVIAHSPSFIFGRYDFFTAGVGYVFCILCQIVLALFGWWLMLRLSFFAYCLIDTRCGMLKAFACSYRITRNRLWLLFGGGLIGLLPYLVLCIPWILVWWLVGIYMQVRVFNFILMLGLLLLFFTYTPLTSVYMYRKLVDHQK